MFTGIIESIGIVKEAKHKGGNLHLRIAAPFAKELKLGDSIAHNGVCLTVVSANAKEYWVTIIEESLSRSNLGALIEGDRVNLERAMLATSRLDGHMVQGHVDAFLVCSAKKKRQGSTYFSFRFDQRHSGLMVEKGSICLNGVSLTIAGIDERFFSVALIPFTMDNTTFRYLKEGDKVNVEYDILGKYTARQLAAMHLRILAEN